MKLLLKCLVAFIGVAVLLFFGWQQIQNWRFKLAWEGCENELKAEGEHLDFAYFIPPPVPDDQNFAMMPLLKPLLDYTRDPKTNEIIYRHPDPPVKKISLYFNEEKTSKLVQNKNWQTGNRCDLQAWQTYYHTALPDMAHPQSPAEDVLAVLGRFDGMLSELREAAGTRPLSRFPIKYEEGVWTPLPHCQVLLQTVEVLALRATAELNLQSGDDAFRDIEFGFRLMDSLHEEPLLLSNLVRISMLNSLMQPVWEGIDTNGWRGDQLAKLQEKFRKMDFLSDYVRAIRAERAFGNATLIQFSENHDLMERYLREGAMMGDVREDTRRKGSVFPFFWKGWFYQNMILEDSSFQEMILAVDLKNRSVDLPRLRRCVDDVQKLKPSPLTIFAKLTLPVFTAASLRCFQAQVYVNEAIIACAIQRYFQTHGVLPATLEELHMADAPHDIINGGPLHYRVIGDDNYVLYSVGGNEVDDGGKVVLRKDGLPDAEKGDWVWTLKPL